MAITVEKIGARDAADRKERVTRDVPQGAVARLHARWIAERGEVIARTRVSLDGAYPGNLVDRGRRGPRELTICPNHLVIDDGTDDGFALAFHEIDAFAIIPSSTPDRPALMIRYVALESPEILRSFTIARPTFPTRSRGVRLGRIASLLADAGVPIIAPNRAVAPRSLAMTWPDARRHADELITWSGTVMAPVGGWMASRQDACKLWLTTDSLFWCDPKGDGVNRLPVDDIIEIVTPPTAHAPQFAIAITDAHGWRQELRFRMPPHRDADLTAAAHASLLAAFCERGVLTRVEPRPAQPWSRPTRSPRRMPIVTPQIPMSDDATPDIVLVAPEGPDAIIRYDDDCMTTLARLDRAIIAAEMTVEEVLQIPQPDPAEARELLAARIASGDLDLLAAHACAQRFRQLEDACLRLRAMIRQLAEGRRSRTAILHERNALMEQLMPREID